MIFALEGWPPRPECKKKTWNQMATCSVSSESKKKRRAVAHLKRPRSNTMHVWIEACGSLRGYDDRSIISKIARVARRFVSRGGKYVTFAVSSNKKRQFCTEKTCVRALSEPFHCVDAPVGRSCKIFWRIVFSSFANLLVSVV